MERFHMHDGADCHKEAKLKGAGTTPTRTPTLAPTQIN